MRLLRKNKRYYTIKFPYYLQGIKDSVLLKCKRIKNISIYWVLVKHVCKIYHWKDEILILFTYTSYILLYELFTIQNKTDKIGTYKYDYGKV